MNYDVKILNNLNFFWFIHGRKKEVSVVETSFKPKLAAEQTQMWNNLRTEINTTHVLVQSNDIFVEDSF